MAAAEIHLVMAQQSIVNVDSRVEQSVVDSTTDVDASKNVSSATSGGNTEENITITTKRGLDPANATEEGNGNGGNIMSESNQKTIEESRTQTPGVGGELVDSDIDIGSGAGSPTKGIVTEGTAKPTLRASIKKPQSFKAVSINKHFLEKSSTGTTNTPAKVVFGSERTSSLSPQVTPSNPTNLSFAKPRLVAKSAPGVRDSSPGGLGASVSGGAKNAVEAQRAVWNKNQPAPTIPTKEMTDEELKKNFGIHLASRIQSEDVGKESTWADEDDDDDWVPETIEWNDGTKVALQIEPTTPTPITAYPVTSQTDETAASTTKTMENESRQGESKTIENESRQSEPKTIEKEPRQSEPKTLVFTKDPNRGIDKSDKGAKDAPPPRTSPWASLPPPNVVSLSNSRTESRASDSGGLQHSTASREVHADDFNRWRDRPLNNQLYNSHTGQMEPVQDQRRGLRAELQLNKTQVLQRPPSQMSGHAEPSPAFQQSRAGPYRQDEYRRRRTSSNVSGGSGSIGRRLSFNKGMHSLEPSINSDEHAISSQYVTSGPPAHSDTQSPQTLYGPLTPTTAISGPNDTASAPLEDPIAMQARIMRETRELARKRRLEEEAKEEAAKKERLRVKLEALEKEAAEKAAKAAAAEAEKAAVLTANLPIEVAPGLAPSSVVTSIEEAAKVSLNDQTDNLVEPNHSNNVFSHNNANVNTDNAPFNSEKQTSSQPDHFKVTAPTPSQGQTQSLASIPYRPGSFGNRSPVKKFSSIQPSAQSSLSSTNTYNMPIRDPRYDTQDPSGTRYANHNRFPYNESARWYDGSSPRASPYGSIGDRSTRALSATENQNGASASSNATVSGTSTADPAAPTPHLNPPHPTLPHSNPPHLHPPHLNPRHMNLPHPNPPHLRSEIPPSSLATHTPQPEVQRVVPNITVQSEAPVNKAATYHTKTQTHQTAGRVGRNSASPPSSATAKFNPWASYPEQLQRQEREELRLAREEVKQNLGAPMPSVDFDYQEVWIQRDPNDPEKILGRHVRGPHSTDTPAQQSSQYLQNIDVPSINQVAQIRPPSSPPPAEFCPVIALDISSDEDSQHGRQPKKFIPHVRLPPQPVGFVDSRPTSSLDSLNKPEIAKPDVTRYDRVLGNIMKTIEVSKGQQSTPSTITPAKFSETKPVYTDERESQQQSSTTVSLPSRVEEARTQSEPEDICTNDEEEFLQRLYVQEFGSQPTVKIPVVYGTYIPQRPLISKAKKTPRPRGFAESVPLFEVVTEDDLLNEQGYPFIPIRLGPDLETKKVVVMKGWSKPLPREPRKPSNYNKNNNRKSGNNNGYYKKEPKPFLNQRQQRMQSPGRPKPSHAQGWERQQHPVV